MARTLIAKFLADVKSFNTAGVSKELDKVSKNAKKSGDKAGKSFGGGVKSGFSGVAKAVGGVVAAGAAVQGIKDVTAAAGDMAETISKNQQIFGNQAKDIENWSKTAATSLGTSQQAALDAASTFAIFGKAAKVKDLSGFSKELTGLSSDLASFHNTKPEDAVNALGSALRGEFEPMRKYGVLINDQVLKDEALRMGLIKTRKQALTPQQKTLAAQATIMKQTKDAQGDFAKTSGGLANQQRIMAAQFENAKVQLGKAFLPAVLAVVKAFNQLMPVIMPVINAFVTQLSPILITVADIIVKQLLPPLMDMIKQVLPIIIPLVKFFADVLAALLPPIVEIATTLLNALLPAFLPLITLLAQTFLPLIIDVAKLLTTILVPALQLVGWIIQKFVVPIISFLIKIVGIGAKAVIVFAQAVITWIQKMWQQIKPALTAIKNWFTVTLPNAAKTLRDRVTSNWNGIKSSINSTINTIKGYFNSFKSGLTTLWNHVKSIKDKIVGIFSNMGSAIGNSMKGLVNHIKQPFKVAFDWINSHVIDKFNALPFAPNIDRINTNFNRGGIVPGARQIGRGKHGDTVPAMLTPGEGVIIPAAVRALARMGLPVNKINKMFGGGTPNTSGHGNFAGGGIAGIGNWLKKTVKNVKDIMADPAGAFNSIMKNMAGSMQSNFFGKMVFGMFDQNVSKIIGWLKGKGAGALEGVGGKISNYVLSGNERKLVSFKGKTFTALFAAGLSKAERLAHQGMSIFQGGFRPSTSYSGSTHNRDAMDIQVNRALIRSLRSVGIPTWDRTGKGNWVAHAHGVPLPFAGWASPSAAGQARSYLSGGDGLGGRDNGPRVAPSQAIKRDRGGWLPTGTSLVQNNTGSPEMVISPSNPIQVEIQFNDDRLVDLIDAKINQRETVVTKVQARKKVMAI